MDLAVDKSDIKSAIYGHPEFATFIDSMNAHFATWRKKSAKTLKSLDAGCHPKQVVADLSENLLSHYADQPLIDDYDVYQHLMDYWAETMQDDCYLIAADGWRAETYRIIEKDKKGKEKDKGWACDLIPKRLIVARYFAKERAHIDKLTAMLESASDQLTEMEEEHGGDEGAFGGFEKITLTVVKARLKELSGEGAEGGLDEDESRVLKRYLDFCTSETALKRDLSAAEVELDTQAYAKYQKLTEADIKTLVVDDKWIAKLDAAIHGEMDRISQAITHRVKELAERYETPLPQVVSRVADLEAKVNRHLETMGFAWM